MKRKSGPKYGQELRWPFVMTGTRYCTKYVVEILHSTSDKLVVRSAGGMAQATATVASLPHAASRTGTM